MKNILICRRTFICTLTLLLLVVLGLVDKIDVSMAMASVAIGLAGANSLENSMKAKSGAKYSE